MVKQIFINLPIKDLKRSVDFFTKLGFSFNPKFTDEKGTCMIIGENIFAMLLTEPFFKSFIKKEVADATKNAEVLLAMSVENREAVDNMIANVIAAGGKEARDRQDYGWMYGRAFEDLDGHIWETFFMDGKNMPSNP